MWLLFGKRVTANNRISPMFNIAPQKDGFLLVRAAVPLSQITWDAGSSGEYKDLNTKELLFIEPACRHDEFMGAPSTVEVGSFNCAVNTTCFAVTLELPEQEMVKLVESCCTEDETHSGGHVEITANVPPNKHRVLATVKYVWPDQKKTAATS